MTRNLNIRSADFKDNAKLTLGDLRHSNDFSDVTLVCEDGRQVEAHKVILASSSPFFKNLLARNKHSHPLIFMRRVTSEVLLAILDFLYLGETSLPEQGLDFFLALAQELQLKGLSGKTTEDPKSHSRTTNTDLGDPLEGSQPRVENELAQDIKAEAVEVENKTEHFEFETRDQLPSCEEGGEDVESLMEKTQNFIQNGKGRVASFLCKTCGKEGRWKLIKRHIRAQHMAIPCSMCQKKFLSQHDLENHKKNRHGNLSKSQEEHEEKLNSMMKKTKNMIPNGPKKTVCAYSCNICGKEGTVKSVKYHIETLHLKKVSLTCKFCDKTFSSRNAAKSHTEKQHSDLVKSEIDAE